ncbi:hypothetical protein Bbelb_243120 [Branchiostoma belcheri]|nr:hypothetical protein Bbelb_243120 [Branchiostoma belcheri]
MKVSSIPQDGRLHDIDVQQRSLPRHHGNAYFCWKCEKGYNDARKHKCENVCKIFEEPSDTTGWTLKEGLVDTCGHEAMRDRPVPAEEHGEPLRWRRGSATTRRFRGDVGGKHSGAIWKPPHACRALLLIPSNLDNLQENHIQQLQQCYEPDLPSPHTFMAGCSGQTTFTLELTTCHPSSNPRVYPNLCKMLHLLLLTPVTSAGVERANSALSFVKNAYRSTMGEDRLNVLLLLPGFDHESYPGHVWTCARRCALGKAFYTTFPTPPSGNSDQLRASTVESAVETRGFRRATDDRGAVEGELRSSLRTHRYEQKRNRLRKPDSQPTVTIRQQSGEILATATVIKSDFSSEGHNGGGAPPSGRGRSSTTAWQRAQDRTIWKINLERRDAPGRSMWCRVSE